MHGYVEPGYVENDIDLPYAQSPSANNSDLVPSSDRAKFDISGASQQVPSSDRATVPESSESVGVHVSHTEKSIIYRQSAYKFFGGYTSTKYTARSVSGVGASTATGRKAGNSLSVTLDTGTVTLAASNVAEVDVIYGATSLGTNLYLPTDRFGDGVSTPIVLFANHDVGGYPPRAYWSLDFTYSLLSDAPQQYTWDFHQEYAIVFPIPVWELNQSWEQQALTLYEWSLEQQWSMGKAEWQVDMFYAISGSQMLHDFKHYLNTLRVDNGLPPFEICVRPVPDIAQQHSIHQRALARMSHESPLYPVGWQTISERITQLGYNYRGAENLAAIAPTRHEGDTVTGYELYDAWYNSPVHYANMVYDFGPDAILEFQLGIEFYFESLNVEDLYTIEATETQWFTVATLNLIDFNYLSGGEKVAVEFALNSQYALQTPTRENIDMFWSTRTFTKVRKPFSSSYALRVAASHSTPYGAYVTVAHTALLPYSIQVDMTHPYGSTVFVVASHSGSYDIEQYAKVSAAHSGSWSLQQTVTHSIRYDDSALVRAAHSATYDDKPSVVRSHTASYEETVAVRAYNSAPYAASTEVRKQHSSPYALVSYVVRGHTALYADQVPVTTAHTLAYDMLSYDPVTAAHRAPFSILSGESVDVYGSYTVAINGIEIDCKSVRLDMDEGEPYWTGTIDITDPSVFSSIARGDEVVIDFYGETFILIADSKTIRRDSPVDVELSVTALSPVALLHDPYAEPIDRTQVTAISARSLAQELLGRTIAWEIHDWTILPYRFAVTQRSPLEAARMIVSAVGGILRSNPDGSLVASYRFPVSIPEYEVTDPVFSVSDVEDNLSYNGRVQHMEVFNEFRIRDTQDYQSDYFEWKLDEGSEDSGILRAYVLPWRPATVECRHTSSGAVNMVYLGIESRTETQDVEIVNGSAQLSWPAVSILSVDWLSDSLGDIYLESRTKEVKVPDTTTNWGYGLAKITYTVECLKYAVQSPAGSSVQFILVDRGM